MSTEQEDAVLLLQLEEKVTRRIRQQIRLMVTGQHAPMRDATGDDIMLEPSAMYNTLASNLALRLINDPSFIADLTRRIGTRMAQTY